MNKLGQLVRKSLFSMAGVSRRVLPHGAMELYAAGAPEDAVFLVETGMVKLVRVGIDGQEVLMALALPGHLFGDLSSPRGRSQAIALGPAVLYEIPSDVFRLFVNSSAEIRNVYLDDLVGRMADLELKIELLALRDAETRVRECLAQLAAQLAPDSGEPAEIPLTQGDLAKLVGATRETTSTILNELERQGLVRLGRKRLYVVSVEGLRNHGRKQGSGPPEN